MTYAPQRLLDIRAYLQPRTGLPAVSLGIIGSAGHHATGTSYHIGWSSLRASAYSRQHPRDVKLKTDAASALDVGSFARLRALTAWMVAEARAGRRPDTREIIGPWSDGRAYRWAAENRWSAQQRARGDSHETHVHESFYRDSENSDKLRYFCGFFEGEDMPITNDDAAKVAHAVWNRESPHLGLVYGAMARYVLNAVRPDRQQTEGARLGFLRDLDRLAAGQEALLAAVSGEDVVAAVRAELDRQTTELTEALDRAAAERAELAELVRQAAAGELAADEVVRLIGERLVAGEPAGDDT